MADNLGTEGKIEGMIGIKNAFANLRILATDNSTIDTTAISPTDFTVSLTTGVVTNDVAVSFTVAAEDVGKTVDRVRYLNSSNLELMTLDLDANKSLDSQGTATFQIGELTASL